MIISFLRNRLTLLVALLMAGGCAAPQSQSVTVTQKPASPQAQPQGSPDSRQTGGAIGSDPQQTLIRDMQEQYLSSLTTREIVRDTSKLVSDGNLPEAIRHMDSLVKREPDHREARYNLAVLLERAGKPAEAEQHYRILVDKDPSDYRMALGLVGNLARTKPQLNSAVSAFRQVMRAHPENNNLKNAMNHLRILSGQYELVIQSCKDILKADERNAPALLNMGRAYLGLNKYELARAIMERVLELDPNNAMASYYLGLVYLGIESKPKAMAYFEQAVKSQPDFAEANNNLAVLYHEAGDYPGAVERLTVATRANPDYADAFLNLGNSLRSQQEFTKAEQAYRKVLEIDPEHADAHFNLGILFLDARSENADYLKQYQDAVYHFNRYRRLKGASLGREDPAGKYIAEAQKQTELEKQRLEQARSVPRESGSASGVTESPETVPTVGEAGETTN